MALTLQDRGVTNVVVLKGGLAAWQRAGYPVEAGTLTPAPATTATPVAALPTLSPAQPGTVALAELGRPDAPVTIVEFSDFQ